MQQPPRALHPGQDIRIENFRDTRLPEDRIDAVIGNVPFADIRLGYGGQPPDPNKSVNSYVKHMKLKYDVTSIPSM